MNAVEAAWRVLNAAHAHRMVGMAEVQSMAHQEANRLTTIWEVLQQMRHPPVMMDDEGHRRLVEALEHRVVRAWPDSIQGVPWEVHDIPAANWCDHCCPSSAARMGGHEPPRGRFARDAPCPASCACPNNCHAIIESHLAAKGAGLL